MNAPEKIWAWEYKGNTPWGEQKPDLNVVTDGAEYTRSDLIPTAAYVAGMEAALRDMLQSVCGPTGFAEAVRHNSGHAYPWHSLDAAEAMSRAALSARPDAPDARVVPVAQLERWYGKMGNWTCQDEIRAVIGEPRK